MDTIDRGSARAEQDGEALLQHTEWLRRLARGLVRDSATGDDLAQEAWRVWSARREPQTLEPRAFLAGVVRNLARGWRRTKDRRRERERVAARPEAMPSVDEVAEELDEQRALVETLRELDEPYRATLFLHYFHGLSLAEIARRSKLPETTVRSRQQRALAQMRQRLDARPGARRDWRQALLAWPGVAVSNDAGPALAAAGGLLAMKTFVTLAAAAIIGTAVWIALRPSTQVERTSAALDSSASTATENGALRPPSAVASAMDESRADGVRSAVETPSAAAAIVEKKLATHIVARIVDEGGRPVAGAQLFVDEGLLAGTSDEAGRIAADLELRGADWKDAHDGDRKPQKLEVRARELATLHAERDFTAGGTSWLGDLALERGTSLSGRVIDRAGAPIEGARVVVISPMPRPYEPGFRANWPGDEALGETRTRSDGSFHFEGLSSGVRTVWANATDRLWTHSDALILDAEHAVESIELALDDPDPSRWIRGRVLDSAGAAVSQAFVVLHAEGSDVDLREERRTDAAGRFEFGLLRPDLVWRLRCEASVSAWEPIELDAVRGGDTDLELRFTESQWIWVQLVDPLGGTIERGRVTAVRAEDSFGLSRGASDVEPDGRARLHVPTEDFRLWVGVPGYKPAIVGPFTKPEPGWTQRVELERMPALRGRVVSAGRGVRGARVSLYQPVRDGRFAQRIDTPLAGAAPWSHFSGKPLVESITDADGRFGVPLAAGYMQAGRTRPCFLTAHADGLAGACIGPLQASPDVDSELVLVLSPGGAIEGRVTVADGRDVAGLEVYVFDARGELRSQQIGADGAYRFEHLHAGDWYVSAYAARIDSLSFNAPLGSVPPEPDVNVRDGEMARFDLDLAPRTPLRIEGVFLVDGGAPGAWNLGLSASRGLSRRVSAPLDRDGHFRIALAEPDLYSLGAASVDERWPSITFSDSVRVESGTAHWSLDLRLGRIEGTYHSSSTQDFDPRKFALIVRGPGELQVRANIAVDEHGRFGPVYVPAGHGEFVPFRPSGSRAPGNVILKEIDVPEGGDPLRVDI